MKPSEAQLRAAQDLLMLGISRDSQATSSSQQRLYEHGPLVPQSAVPTNAAALRHAIQTARQQQKPFIIRPITPSTLIALTEPCLMAWCMNIKPEPVPDFASNAHHSQTSWKT